MSSPNQKFIYLHFVDGSSGNNNNKFYKMEVGSNGSTWTATYGREGAAKPATETYPMSKWETKYKEKIKKGYTDVTEFKTVIKESKSSARNSNGQIISKDPEVVKLIEFLQNLSNNLTKANYDVEARSVTQSQIDTAQKQINLLFDIFKEFGTNKFSFDNFNKELTKLYIIIPRKMKNVSDHLFASHSKKETVIKKLEDEQDLLDSMASQVTTNTATDEEESEVNETTLIESLGLEMSIVTDAREIANVKSNCQTHGHKINRVFRVVNKKAQERFDKSLAKANNKTTRLLWHGSRSVNWISILQNSLIIRPSGVAYSGSAFGDGIYFASEDDKSMGYTDGGRWNNTSRGNYVYMALFNVHVGKQYIIYDNKTLSSKSTSASKEVLKKAGDCDSTWARKAADRPKDTSNNWGYGLQREELIVYNSDQCTISYLIEFKV